MRGPVIDPDRDISSLNRNLGRPIPIEIVKKDIGCRFRMLPFVIYLGTKHYLRLLKLGILCNKNGLKAYFATLDTLARFSYKSEHIDYAPTFLKEETGDDQLRQRVGI